MKPYCHVVAVLAVAIEEVATAVCVFSLSSLSLWIVTHKIRAGSDFDVIRTSTRTYRTDVRYKQLFSTLLASVGLAHARPSNDDVWVSVVELYNTPINRLKVL